MSREEQIDEMCKDLVEIFDEEYEKRRLITADFTAIKMSKKGYRKQEWISVEERLPTLEDGKVLIYTPYGISIAQKTTTNHWKGENAIPKLITHWMHLPEPPKGE